MNDILTEDLERIISSDFIPWEEFRDKTVFITGATGLIGKTLVRTLYRANSIRDLHLKLLLLVRDLEKAKTVFSDIIDDEVLGLIIGNVGDEMSIPDPINYVIHCASQTESEKFVTHPVETIQTTVLGVDKTLRLAQEKNVESYVFLSSMEVYGYPGKGHRVTEKEIGCFVPDHLRNSYPISKIQGEALCFAYAKEYGAPAKIIRLAQTFGPGVDNQDQRIFAYLARCAVEKKDIVLKTYGQTERCYLYTADAVTAILTVLLKGENSKIYNAANEETYCSVADMADMVAGKYNVRVVYDIQDEVPSRFPDTIYLNMDTSALRGLGWKPAGKKESALLAMFQRMICSMKKKPGIKDAE